MELDKKDIMAIAHSRVQRGKVNFWLLLVGLLWLVGIIVGLFFCDEFTNLLLWLLWSIAIFVVGMVVVIGYTKYKAQKLFKKLEKEENVDTNH
jgi:uncharacterized membrane protein YdjX (TVP38/TMEM64 family)